jgi:ribose transport system substrate-binding protein
MAAVSPEKRFPNIEKGEKMGEDFRVPKFRLNRRHLVGGAALGSASFALSRHGLLAQDATPSPGATPEVETGCIGEPKEMNVPTLPEGTPLKIAIVPKLVHPFFEDTRIGAQAEADALGVEFQWVAPQTGDPAIQVQMIEDLVRAQVNSIVISPNDPTSVESVIADATSNGILCLTFDSDSPESERVMYIGTDNKSAGTTQGETLLELIGGSGKIAIITGGLAALNLNQRIEGLKEALPDSVEVVETVATDDDLQKGLSVSESLLRAHPDLNGIACMSATGGPTLAQVMQGPEFQDLIGVLKVVAFDDLDETKAGIEAGVIQATMVQRPVLMGTLSIRWAHDLLLGLATPPCENLDTKVTVVTLENINTYTK